MHKITGNLGLTREREREELLIEEIESGEDPGVEVSNEIRVGVEKIVLGNSNDLSLDQD